MPDGDTDKVDRAAQAWDRLATVYQIKTVPEALDVQAGIFSSTSTPEVEYIGKDLGELREAANAILAACGELAQSCRDYRSALDDLRNQLKGILKDLRSSWRPRRPSVSRRRSSPSASGRLPPPRRPRTQSRSSQGSSVPR